LERKNCWDKEISQRGNFTNHIKKKERPAKDRKGRLPGGMGYTIGNQLLQNSLRTKKRKSAVLMTRCRDRKGDEESQVILLRHGGIRGDQRWHRERLSGSWGKKENERIRKHGRMLVEKRKEGDG